MKLKCYTGNLIGVPALKTFADKIKTNTSLTTLHLDGMYTWENNNHTYENIINKDMQTTLLQKKKQRKT